MEISNRTMMTAFVIGITIATVRWIFFLDARWWNLVMAVLLMVLALYLLRERRRSR